MSISPAHFCSFPAGRMWIYDIHPKTVSDSTAPYTQVHLRELGLPRTIDMALSCPSWPQSTYFLKKGKVWHYSDLTGSILEGPLQIQNLWNGLPTRRMDAAFTYNGEKHILKSYLNIQKYFSISFEIVFAMICIILMIVSVSVPSVTNLKKKIMKM